MAGIYPSSRAAVSAAHHPPRGAGHAGVRRDSEQAAADAPSPAELLRAIVDASPFATMAFDRDRRVIFWSAAAERIFGWRADEMLGQPFPMEAIPPEDRVSSAERISRTLKGTIISGDRVRRLTRDGHEVILEIYGGVLRGPDREPIGYAGQMIDVSERETAIRNGEAERRAALTDLLQRRAFHPVFQPIVELASGEVVGHEALTRFDSGQQPDECFADAWSVELGRELEYATLAAAVDAARRLPAARWLNLNVSPRLLMDDLARLRQILKVANRPVVLEVTEHEIVADYGALRAAVSSLGQDVRLAVDDAGAGVANFGHIVELRPDFVKLDTSLVRGVNSNLGRQALVVGMGHFARTAGCRLVAEGIETEDEARALAHLGVEFGQGHWFGRPSPAPARRSSAK